MCTAKTYRLFVLLVSLSLLGIFAQSGHAQVNAITERTHSVYPGVPDLHAGIAERFDAVKKSALVKRNAALYGTSWNENEGLKLLSFLDLGVSSDVWAHRNFAYVGGFFNFFTGSGFTPVRVVDISDPANPVLVKELPGRTENVSPQDVKVARIKTAYFKGDLLVVGNDGFPDGGIQLWDVSNPRNPVLLSQPQIAPIHNVFLFQRGARAFVLLASPLLEVASQPPSIFADFFDQPRGDVILVEVTDPRNPVILSDWGAGKDGGFPYGFATAIPEIGFPADCDDPSICRGADPTVLCHDVWVNEEGTIAYLSYWDLGLILLDISDPSQPKFMARGVAPSTFGNDEGNLHNAVPMGGGKLILTGDEDFSPLPSGFLRVFKSNRRSRVEQISAFATDGALNNGSGFRTMHNIFVKRNKAFLSWYDEGILVLDMSRPTSPREVARFTAPAGTGPGTFWGVYTQRNLVFGSDLFGGLFILKYEDDHKDVRAASLSSSGSAEATVLNDQDEYGLSGNYPNPFNPQTEIQFQLQKTEYVVLKIFNALGQEVRTLVNSAYEPGSHAVRWDAKDNRGQPVPSGTYFYRLTAGDMVQTRQMTLLK